MDTLFVQNVSIVLVEGANKETCFGSPSFSTPVLFLKLDGTKTSLVYCFAIFQFNVFYWDLDLIVLASH